MKKIAHIESDFPTKFGIPRQSGLVKELKAKIIFEPEYRTKDAFRGLEEYSHIWLLWEFSENKEHEWKATVRPPRLGGNKRVGVFATRSPFRPNPIGLSAVKLLSIEHDKLLGTVLYVAGADLMNGTPIYDIKPYLPYTDSHPEAKGGFSEDCFSYKLKAFIPDSLSQHFTEEQLSSLTGILENDPRPSYQNDTDRVYGFQFFGYDIRFTVEDGTARVTDACPLSQHQTRHTPRNLP